MPQSTRIRCLLIDDDQAAFHLAQAIMDQIPWAEFDLEWVETMEEGAKALARQEHDVYLVDYLIGEASGIDLVRQAREKGNRSPMILLTGKGRYDVDVEAMEAGLSDYLDKTRVDPDLMERSIRYAIERSRSEAALRDSEARHRSMFRHVPVGLFRTTMDGELLEANPALLRILGEPDQEVLEFDYGRNFFVSPTHRQSFLDRLDQFGIVRGFESELNRPDGRTIRVRCSARAHRDEDGMTQYVEGAVEDVTEAVEARRVHGRASRFTWIYETSGLAALILELDGALRGANAAFLTRFGYDADDLRGKSLADLVDADDGGTLTRQLSAAAQGTAEVSPAELRFLTAAGETLRAPARIGLVRSFRGDPDHLLVLLGDDQDATPK